jgi:hypothetical protein
LQLLVLLHSAQGFAMKFVITTFGGGKNDSIES